MSCYYTVKGPPSHRLWIKNVHAPSLCNISRLPPPTPTSTDNNCYHTPMLLAARQWSSWHALCIKLLQATTLQSFLVLRNRPAITLIQHGSRLMRTFSHMTIRIILAALLTLSVAVTTTLAQESGKLDCSARATPGPLIDAWSKEFRTIRQSRRLW